MSCMCSLFVLLYLKYRNVSVRSVCSSGRILLFTVGNHTNVNLIMNHTKLGKEITYLYANYGRFVSWGGGRGGEGDHDIWEKAQVWI